MGRRDGVASVQDILGEAGLSTRAFYRHFPSKDELVLTMYRTASEREAAGLEADLVAANGPVEAFTAFVHRHLAVAYEPRRARQTSVLISLDARSAAGFDPVDQEARAVRRTMLAGVIGEGMRHGVFPGATDPDADARAVLGAIGAVVDAKIAGQQVPSWDDAAAHITRLFLRAFEADTPSC
jgi:AcrR family transcriptional regulator